MTSTTRERILDAALALIMRHGFGGTAVTDIEAAAGLSPGSGSFYRHFRSKEEVFTAVFERELERAQEHRRTFERGPVTGDPQEVLARRFRQQLAYLTAVRPLIALLAREHTRFPELADKIGGVLLDEGISEEAAHLSGDLGTRLLSDDPHATLAVVVSALTGYHLAREFFGHPPADIDEHRFAAALAALLAPPTP
ncbi:TetR/AcrR family transcriptional regulator [Thermomonospora echinospora]|uniref:TetR/AcrR family transcriptional regulator n=1 Tax=Thermomonospora echinospora TaxID=1992 RepID=UPI00135BCA55|nr:TetR/AcrR family transcriptional regulator [Thermomonospora echinospora]